MALRPDSIYRVDLGHSGTPVANDRGKPPRVIQIRLTEHTLHELVAAHAQPGSTGKIRINVDQTDPMLMIGGVTFPLQAPLASSGSASATPAELFRLSDDETTLMRLGAVTTKLSVKPTSNVSAAAQRLKHQREEEELRKEERKRAVMLGSNALPTSSASKRAATNNSRSSSSSVNKNLSAVRSLGQAGGSPLSRSASLNKLSTRNDFRSNGSSFPSREQSLSAQAHRLPHQSLSNNPPSKFQTMAMPRPTKASKSLEELLSDSDENDQDGRRSDDSPNVPQKAYDATKKTVGGPAGKKLTTRQRLAKAAKGGSRMLPDIDQRTSGSVEQPAPAMASSASTKAPDTIEGVASPRPKALGHRRATSAISVKDFEREASVRLSGLSRQSSPSRASADADHLHSTLRIKAGVEARLSPVHQPTRDPASSLPSKNAKDADMENDGRKAAKRVTSMSPDRTRPAPHDKDKLLRTSSTSSPSKFEVSKEEASSTKKRRRSDDFVDTYRIPERKVPAQGPRAGTGGTTHARIEEPFSKQRTVKGVGPGATHWSEPWLDVRSKADWHKLADRFAKAQEEYNASRHRLEEEGKRLDAELQLAGSDDSREALGLASNSPSALHSSQASGNGEVNADGSARLIHSRPSKSDDESPEEGEMVSSDEDRDKIQPTAQADQRLGLPPVSSIDNDDELGNLVWRQTSAANNTARQPGPLSYKELSDKVARLHELHGSLSRMYHVLVAFSKRDETA